MTKTPAWTDEIVTGWYRKLLVVNLNQFEPVSDRTQFFAEAPQFITALYPDTDLRLFLPENYGAYMLHCPAKSYRPRTILRRYRWRQNLLLFANVTEWISYALPYMQESYKLDEAADQRLRTILRHGGPTPPKLYHAAARIRINLHELFHFCEAAVANTAEYQRVTALRERGDQPPALAPIYDTWFPLYKQVLAGELADIPRPELDKMTPHVVELQQWVQSKHP